MIHSTVYIVTYSFLLSSQFHPYSVIHKFSTKSFFYFMRIWLQRSYSISHFSLFQEYASSVVLTLPYAVYLIVECTVSWTPEISKTWFCAATRAYLCKHFSPTQLTNSTFLSLLGFLLCKSNDSQRPWEIEKVYEMVFSKGKNIDIC